jgi:hypothetical protein
VKGGDEELRKCRRSDTESDDTLLPAAAVLEGQRKAKCTTAVDKIPCGGRLYLMRAKMFEDAVRICAKACPLQQEM